MHWGWKIPKTSVLVYDQCQIRALVFELVAPPLEQLKTGSMHLSLTLIAWLDPLKSLGYEFRIPKFTLEFVKYIRESILSDAFYTLYQF